MKVLALAAYPERMAATRFRVCAYLPYLEAMGIAVELVPWLDDRSAANLYRRGGRIAAAAAAARGAVRQLRSAVQDYDVVWVQREAIAAGPPFVEAMARMRGLPIVVDYDDAIWIAQGGPLKRAAKCAWKFDWILRRAAHAVAGSRALEMRARSFGIPSTVLPTVVERSVWTPRRSRTAPRMTIGWIGTHSTAPQLDLAAPALRRLRDEGHDFRVVVIGAGDRFRLDDVEVECRPWGLSHEIDDFGGLDIGLAPMHQSQWHEGKCGFKQVQYMSVGVPCVSSMVGGARDFVVHEQNALVAETPDDWYLQIRRLLIDESLRAGIAARGRELVATRLCVEAQASILGAILRGAARPGRS